MPEDAVTEPIRFRAGKKRKAYRQRTDDGDDDDIQPDNPTSSPHPHESLNGDNGDEGSVAAALRLRNARKARLRGVGFNTASRPDETAGALVPRTQDEAHEVAVPTIASRFTHQTGALADMNDKHMMEYIESRLSSRSAPAGESQAHEEASSSAEPSTSNAAHPRMTGQEIMQGRLMEIDLSEVARNQNPSSGTHTPTDGPGPRKRIRLGRDGKPWRPRNRRGSDDIKRDQLVEEILRESRLDVYDVSSAVETQPEEDGAADERLAEEFRRQFLDEAAEREMRRRKKKQPAPTARPGQSEDVLRGPKLGGSRNSRAAVRDILLKREKEGKK